MTKAVQRRKGTDSEHSTFTGLEAEITVNTTNQSVHVHDGSTAGGFELARADGSNVDDFAVGGNLTVTGNTTINGTLTLGDSDTDSITINADLTSDLIPNATNTYDLGTASKQWKDIYIDGTAYIDAINFNGTAITATGAELNYVDGVTSAIQTQIDGKQDSDAQLTDIAGLTPTDGNFIVGDGANFVAESGATARTSLGLGSIATQDSSSISITGGTIDGVTIGGSSAGAGTFTTLTANTSITGTLATAAQPNITSVGTLTGFTSTGIDDNATSTAIQIDSNGDISFYEDTGTTPKFFWDASAEALAVGGTNTFTSKIVASAANGTAYSSNSQLRISGGGTNNNRASIIFSDDALSDGKISYYPHATESSRLLSLSARTTESDFVIKGDGNVGIGTSSPSAPLTVNTGSDGNNVYIDNNGTQLAIGSTSSVNYINTQNGNAALAIQTNGTERLRVDASGNVGIGTSSPTYVLDVYSSSVSQISASRSGGSRVILGTDTSTGEYVGTISNTDFKILTNSSARMRITNTGAIFMPSLSYASASTDLNYNTSTGEVFVVTSSMRYKSNIADLDIDTSKVLALRPVSYTDNNSGINAVGLIAEEVHEEIPQLVNYKEIEGYDEIQPDSVKYSTLSVYLLKVIQEQQTIIEDLKARITALENA